MRPGAADRLSTQERGLHRTDNDRLVICLAARFAMEDRDGCRTGRPLAKARLDRKEAEGANGAMKMHAAEAGSMSHVINYGDYLESRIKRSTVRRNELTREKLKAAAVSLLESGGYHDTPISTFCEQAGLAKGTFYLHFADKEDLVAHVLEEYADLQVKIMPSAAGSKDAYAALIVLNSWFAETFCENVGMHRSMMQLSETIPRITKIWSAFLTGLSARYVDEIRRWSNTTLDPDFATFVTYCLWGMLDQALYAIYAVKRNPDFERLAKNRSHLVQSITLFQHRALFLENPSAAFDKSIEGFLALRGRA